MLARYSIRAKITIVVCFLLITLYIAHDLKFDQYHVKKDRIFRLALGSLEEGVPNSSVSGGVMPGVIAIRVERQRQHKT